jgi:PKD domain
MVRQGPDSPARLRPALLGAGLAALVVALSFALTGSSQARSGRAATPPKVSNLKATVTGFGVVATAKLAEPLDRTAMRKGALEVGLVLAVHHRDGSLAGVTLRSSRTRLTTRPAGKLGSPVLVMSTGRRAWFFVPDPNAEKIDQIAVGSYAALGRRAGARASIGSASGYIEDIADPSESSDIDHVEVFYAGLATPPPPTPGRLCDELRRQIPIAEETLLKNRRNPYPIGDAKDKHKGWAAAVRGLKRWLVEARKYLAANCPPPGSGSDGSGSTGTSSNQTPTVQFQTSDSGKAGVASTFRASASDPDGTVDSWIWDWGDGTRTQGSGADPSTTHTYMRAGVYEVRLTATDNKGGSTTTPPALIFISAAGSKRSDEEDPFQIECPDSTFTSAELDFYVFIPSYAEEPITFTLAPGPRICPDSTQQVLVAERLNSNTAGRRDEWGNLKDTYHIRIRLTHAGGTGGQTVNPVATVNWR